jgi:1-aminocyclopropane-1-carboxylate deaminase/D-cysteine desulfhydrase-like pyridoxal-dependent ACC family enzyme
MSEEGMGEFITFGGPFSNHLFASATLAGTHNLEATFFVRGSVDDRCNPVLKHARQCGVKLVAVDRRSYANRYSSEFKSELKTRYPSAYVIPEGGANLAGLRGCSEIVSETIEQSEQRPDFWIVAAGTGNTASGIASQLLGSEKVMAIAGLRAAIMKPAFQASLGMIPKSARSLVSLSDEYNFGGMAKWNIELLTFIQEFEARSNILLDPVYTGKAMYALFDLAANGIFPRGSNIVIVHTGGMPGRLSFNYRFGDLLPDPGP